MGTRDYVQKNNFKGILIGSSGGIDSALTAAVATDALGPEKVNTVMMPFRYTADMSIEDAQKLSKNLGFTHEVIPISEMFNAFKNSLNEKLEPKEFDKTEENLQSRCRGVTLMALSNNLGYLVLTTGNKVRLLLGIPPYMEIQQEDSQFSEMYIKPLSMILQNIEIRSARRFRKE